MTASPPALWDGARLWALHATHGFPLELSLPLLWDAHGALPTWGALVEAAERDGANRAALLRRLDSIAGDYPPAIRDAVRTGLARL